MADDSDSLIFAHDCVMLDACSAINLYATGQMRPILESIPKPVMIAVYVLDVETLTLRGPADGAPGGPDERIDLQPLIASGHLTVVSPDSEAEKRAFIDFSAALRDDDGEAVTGAIAVHRNWAIATDDKHAIRFFRQEFPHIQIISSLALVRHWADTSGPEADLVRRSLLNMKTRATYVPGRGHALYAWWEAAIR